MSVSEKLENMFHHTRLYIINIHISSLQMDNVLTYMATLRVLIPNFLIWFLIYKSRVHFYACLPEMKTKVFAVTVYHGCPKITHIIIFILSWKNDIKMFLYTKHTIPCGNLKLFIRTATIHFHITSSNPDILNNNFTVFS